RALRRDGACVVQAQTCVVVFALTINDLPESSGFVNLPHFIVILSETGSLEHHVIHAGSLYCIKQLFSIFEIAPDRRNSNSHMLVMLQYLNAMTHMTGSIRSNPDRFNSLVLHHIFKSLVHLLPTGGLCTCLPTLRDHI